VVAVIDDAVAVVVERVEAAVKVGNNLTEA
jgi:hypothetical protein